jgi:hypothetical protein
MRLVMGGEFFPSPPAKRVGTHDCAFQLPDFMSIPSQNRGLVLGDKMAVSDYSLFIIMGKARTFEAGGGLHGSSMRLLDVSIQSLYCYNFVKIASASRLKGATPVH